MTSLTHCWSRICWCTVWRVKYPRLIRWISCVKSKPINKLCHRQFYISYLYDIYRLMVLGAWLAHVHRSLSSTTRRYIVQSGQYKDKLVMTVIPQKIENIYNLNLNTLYWLLRKIAITSHHNNQVFLLFILCRRTSTQCLIYIIFYFQYEIVIIYLMYLVSNSNKYWKTTLNR